MTYDRRQFITSCLSFVYLMAPHVKMRLDVAPAAKCMATNFLLISSASHRAGEVPSRGGMIKISGHYLFIDSWLPRHLTRHCKLGTDRFKR
jgi:hypothetical protein